jgi:hypothetical protein
MLHSIVEINIKDTLPLMECDNLIVTPQDTIDKGLRLWSLTETKNNHAKYGFTSTRMKHKKSASTTQNNILTQPSSAPSSIHKQHHHTLLQKLTWRQQEFGVPASTEETNRSNSNSNSSRDIRNKQQESNQVTHPFCERSGTSRRVSLTSLLVQSSSTVPTVCILGYELVQTIFYQFVFFRSPSAIFFIL